MADVYSLLRDSFKAVSYTHLDVYKRQGLKRDALAADQEGFRFSLHAQGDGAIGKTVDIFAQCQRDENGKLKNRQAITDLECSDPADLERMGQLGIVAEVYPQIMSIADRASKIAMIEEKIGMDRGLSLIHISS